MEKSKIYEIEQIEISRNQTIKSSKA